MGLDKTIILACLMRKRKLKILFVISISMGIRFKRRN